MSYILEALKKSERERQRGSIAALHTPSQVALNQRSLWTGILIGAAALTALATIAWVANRELMRPAPVSAVSSPASEPRLESGTSTGETSRPAGADLVSGSQPAATGGSSSSATGEPGASGGSAPAAVRDVDSIDELDPEDRARIQRLSLNVVSYSEVPARRFVMINQRIAHESETVGDGVVVDRILPGGALLRVGGYRIMIRPD